MMFLFYQMPIKPTIIVIFHSSDQPSPLPHILKNLAFVIGFQSAVL